MQKLRVIRKHIPMIMLKKLVSEDCNVLAPSAFFSFYEDFSFVALIKLKTCR